MTIGIKQLNLGTFATNAYIIGDTETNEAILIDPVDDAPLLYQTAVDAGWTIKIILATHAHIDHVLASRDLKEMTGAPFWIHEDCVMWLKGLPQQAKFFGLHDDMEAATPDRLLTTDPEIIELGAIKLETMYTPGHLSFYMREHKIVFSGDSLFAGSIGRTDLPGGDYELLMQSIFTQLMILDDDVQVLPGHMGATTVGRERISNPFLLSYENPT